MDFVLKFGNVFRHNEQEYVYLVGTADTIYTARVLDPDISRRLIGRSEATARNPGNPDSPLFAFVVLSTAELNGRAAHYAPPYDDVVGPGLESVCDLTAGDVARLRNEMLESSFVPGVLRELLRASE